MYTGTLGRIICRFRLPLTARTEEPEGRGLMRTFFRGTDRGNAAIAALVLIIVMSLVFIALTERIDAAGRYAAEYKARTIRAIEETNREIMEKYDLY